MVLEKINTKFAEMECEVMRISESSEIDSSDEIEEEFWAVMENVKPEVDHNPVISHENLEECSQSYEASPPPQCRLCAISDDDMVNIFDCNRTDRNIVEKIERCLPIVVKETDPLSKQACRSCLASLELCYQFHKTVVKAERQLLALEKPPNKPRNVCVSVIRSNKKSKRMLEQSSEAETTSNKRRTVGVKSIVQLANSEPCSLLRCNAKTFVNTNSNTERIRHSSDAQLSIGKFYSLQHSSATMSDQENTCDLEVLENAESTIFSSQSEKTVEHPVEPDIYEVYNNVEPAYGCDSCPKKFFTKCELVMHRKVHFRERTFCFLPARDRKFARQTSIKQTTATYPKTINYHSKSYKSSSSGNSHTVDNSIVKWQCGKCNASFWKIGELNRHLKLCKLQNSSPSVKTVN